MNIFARYNTLFYILIILSILSCSEDDITNDVANSSLPQIADLSVADVGETSISVSTVINDDGGSEIKSFGLFWSKNENPKPDVTDYTEKIEITKDTAIATISNLKPSHTYSIRAYAVNSAGVGYSPTIFVKTLDETFTPRLSMPEIIIVNVDSVLFSSKIECDGGADITSKGFCYTTSTKMPIISDSIVRSAIAGDTLLALFNGAVIGQKYYVRSFAANKNGVSYSGTATFTVTTLPTSAPTTISRISTNGATLSSAVVDNGGAVVSEKGFVYSSENAEPVLEDEKIISTIVGDTILATLDNLTAGTRYYVRSYVINSVGVVYGDTASFIVATPPMLSDATLSNIIYGQAYLHSLILDVGGLDIKEKGVVYTSVSDVPTCDDTKAVDISEGDSINVILNELIPGTTYRVRAYATNDIGTAYSNTLSVTLPISPIFSTIKKYYDGYNVVTISSEIIRNGDFVNFEKGYVYSTTNTKPTLADTKIISTAPGTSIMATISDIMPDVIYYVRPYIYR